MPVGSASVFHPIGVDRRVADTRTLNTATDTTQHMMIVENPHPKFVRQALVNLRALMELDVLEAACEQAVLVKLLREPDY